MLSLSKPRLHLVLGTVQKWATEPTSDIGQSIATKAGQIIVVTLPHVVSIMISSACHVIASF